MNVADEAPPSSRPEAGHGGEDGDGESFEAFVEARLAALLRLGYALTGNPHDGSDLVQEALERLGLRWSALQRSGGNPHAYVRTIMVNARTSRWRRSRREHLVADPPEAVRSDRYRFEDDPLWQAVRQLPQQQRAVVVLRFYEDLSENEIAVTLGVSTGTVKSHASRAMTALRSQLSTSGTPTRGGQQ